MAIRKIRMRAVPTLLVSSHVVATTRMSLVMYLSEWSWKEWCGWLIISIHIKIWTFYLNLPDDQNLFPRSRKCCSGSRVGDSRSFQEIPLDQDLRKDPEVPDGLLDFWGRTGVEISGDYCGISWDFMGFFFRFFWDLLLNKNNQYLPWCRETCNTTKLSIAVSTGALHLSCVSDICDGVEIWSIVLLYLKLQRIFEWSTALVNPWWIIR